MTAVPDAVLTGEAAPQRVEDPGAVTGGGPTGRSRRWELGVVGAVVALGVIARLPPQSELWLDEALTVNVSKLPLGDIPAALRHDGSPPLYYFLLHGWMRIFGDGTDAVRALSGLLGILCLPLAWRAGDHVGGRRVATAALVLFAVSPFAVHFATEARMYSLLMVLVLAGGMCLAAVVERRSLPAAIGLGLATGALLLSHYWSVYLLVVVAAVLAGHALRSDSRAGARRGLVAMAAGSLLFVPWVPSFLFQAERTGAPWGNPPHANTLIESFRALAGGFSEFGPWLLVVFQGLMVLAIFGRAVDGRRVELYLLGREPGRTLGLVAVATLSLGLVVGRITGNAYADRYGSIVFPVVLILAALGVGALASRRIRAAVLAFTVAVALYGLWPVATAERTQAVVVARALRAGAQPGDVVAYCPDQLGPSVSRLLPDGLVQLTFPRQDPPEVVDWVDYQVTNRRARVRPFVDSLQERAGPDHAIWLVWSGGYRTFGTKCEQIRTALSQSPGASRRIVNPSARYPERFGLSRYSPPPTT